MFHKVSGTLVDKSLTNLSRFVDVYYSTEYQNATDPNNIQIKTRRYEVKWCTKDDFAYSQQSIAYFKKFAEQSILCPNFFNGDGFKL